MTKYKFIRFVPVALLVCLLLGCGPKTVDDPVYDFILNLPDATRGFPLIALDLSNPNHHESLGKGWHLPEKGSVPLTRFLWTAAEVAEVHFTLEAPVMDMSLFFNVRPFQFDDSPEVTLTLQLNEHYLGEVCLSKDWRTYRLNVPANTLVPGINSLFIHQSEIFDPNTISPGTIDTRILGSTYAYFLLKKQGNPPIPGSYTLPQLLGASNFHFKGLQRQVLHDTPPAEFSYQLTLPSNPVISFGAGIIPDTVDQNHPGACFNVSISEPGSKTSETIWEAVITPPVRVLEMDWLQVNKDLSRFAGKNVVVTFSTDTADSGKASINQGSWLSPEIRNKHLPVNLIFFPASGGSWPMPNPPEGSGLKTLKSISFVQHDFEPLTSSGVNQDEISIPGEQHRLPMPLIRKLKSEGWQTGYFYTGRNPIYIEDFLESEFDSLVGFNESSRDRADEIYADAMDWMRRLGNHNFALLFDPSGSEFHEDQQYEVMEIFIHLLIDLRIEEDTILVLYNPDRVSDMWLYSPAILKKSQNLNLNNWESLQNEILKLLLIK